MAIKPEDITGGFVAEGNGYFQLWKLDGTLGPVIPAGNLLTFEIKSSAEVQQRKSRRKGEAGNVVGSVATRQPPTLTISTDETGSARNLAMALMASITAGSAAKEDVVDEPVTASLGNIVRLGKTNIDGATLVLKNSTGSKTYVEGVDYTIESAAFGFVRFLRNAAAGAIADGATLKASYSTTAHDYLTLDGSTEAIIKASVYLDGVNRDTGQELEVMVHRWAFTPSTGVDFLTDKFSNLGLSGVMEIPAGARSAYTVKLKGIQ